MRTLTTRHSPLAVRAEVAAGPGFHAVGAPRLVTETDLDTEKLKRTLSQLLPRYKVLLHNDDHNSMDHVVRSLQRVVHSLSHAQAVQIMLEAHTTGVAVVTICPKELAEHYRDGLRARGLTSTIELDS
jgi:ATP-dependent Clp protease adaptor protein ClpS